MTRLKYSMLGGMFMACASVLAQPAPQHLRVDLLEHPDSMFVSGKRAAVSRKPCFSWTCATSNSLGLPRYWHIRVASSPDRLVQGKADFWDSGMQEYSPNTTVTYQGTPLLPASSYYWTVQLTDANGHHSRWAKVQCFTTQAMADTTFGGYPLTWDVLLPKKEIRVRDSVFVDFGQEDFGTLRLHLEQAPDVSDTITVLLGESQHNHHVDMHPQGNIRVSSYHLYIHPDQCDYTLQLRKDARNTATQDNAEGSRPVLMPKYIGEVTPFRYAEIIGLDVPFRVTRTAVHEPFDDQAASFESSDSVLNAVWALCKHSMKATSFCGYYVDGDRERIAYEADAYINQLSHYAVDSEYSMARRTTAYLIKNPTWPTEWILITPQLAWNDYLYTGDNRLLQHYYRDIQAKALTALADSTCLISSTTGKQNSSFLKAIHFRGKKIRDIVDWPQTGAKGIEKENGGETDGFVFCRYNAVVNAYYYGALDALEKISRALSKKQEAKHYAHLKSKVRQAYYKTFFDAQRGIFCDGDTTRHASLHANMFPLAFGLVDKIHTKTVADFCVSRRMACSVYGAQFLLDALYQQKRADEALALLSAKGKRSWWNMMRMGSTITTEAWDNVYKPNLDWNHAWGAAAGNIIVRQLLGVRPAAPGFRKVFIAPQPSRLESVKAKVPTPCGPLYMKLQNNGNSMLNLDVDLPDGMTAEVQMPGMQKPTVIVPGTKHFHVSSQRYSVNNQTNIASHTRLPHGKLTVYQHPHNKIYHKGWIDLNKNGKMDVYENPKADVSLRIENLLSQMTMEEKTCQLVTLYGYKRILQDDLPTPEWKGKIWKDGMGAIDEHLNGFVQWGLPPSDNLYCWPASRHAWALNEVQRWFIEQTRLGIPVDFTNEGIRGVENKTATCFPTPLGLGSTWDRALIRQVGYITGREARLLGYTNVYAPVLDVIRDQRWGRCEESYGESPYLVGEFGVQLVKGMQTDHQVASTAKHFVAYSNNKGAREGMARDDPQMSPREIENIHLYPFRRAIGEAGMLGVMCAYNDYDGIPLAGSYYWLTQRLRQELGFRGYVVSDSEAVEYLSTKHATAADMKDAIRQAVNAGIDVRCTFRTPDSYVLPLRELVKEGKVSTATLDERVRNVLRVKFLTGLFDRPYQEHLREADTEVNSQANNDVALRASRESIVLLKNEGHLLPLDMSRTKRIAVIGPNADETAYATTHYGPLDVKVTSVLEGLRMRAKATGTHIVYAKGCALVDDHWPESELIDYPPTQGERDSIQAAADSARACDIAVVVLGGGQRTCGENKSRSSLNLPGHQLQLLQAVCATGKPVILVLINGRPLTINWASRYVPSILEAWYPGAHGGTALADIISGDYNPGGKLTVTIPKTVGQLPFNFPTKPFSQVDGGRKLGPNGNATRANGALYPFGFGLSYTTFRYSGLRLSQETINRNDSIVVSCTVTNSGDRAGDEIVQLYVRDVVSSVTTYEKRLQGFERIHLKAGESKDVHFTLHPSNLQLYNAEGEWVVEPGEFRVMIGSSSEDIHLKASFTVTE